MKDWMMCPGPIARNLAIGVAVWPLAGSPLPAAAHLIGDAAHDHGTLRYSSSVKPPQFPLAPLPGPVPFTNPRLVSANSLLPFPGMESPPNLLSSIFTPFAPAVKTRADADYLYVESDSMPAHRMMVGITAWQQQAPLPQPYNGSNAWRVPLRPVAARNPLSARDHFFRGAIALAANGVPIFNPIKNDGRTDTFLAGELDEFGGHCGRADDYHYHIAPTHLQGAVGAGRPLAVALDGYLIYGFTEPGGGDPEKLDAFNGHSTSALGYHYHATRAYPYLNGGFHGEVIEKDGQVDPQPRAMGVRPALPPLRGARITGFTSVENRSFSLQYQLGGETHRINYVRQADGSVKFDFVDGAGRIRTETYSPRREVRSRETESGEEQARGSRRRPPGQDRMRGSNRPPDAGPPPNGLERPRGSGDRPSGRGQRPQTGDNSPQDSPLLPAPQRSGRFRVTSPAVADGQPLPVEFTGDGAGSTPPLEWAGAPPETKSYALVMDHRAPEGVKSYWVMWDIPAPVDHLPKNSAGVGKVGATWRKGRSYVPPHSRGPGKKTYTIHLYALSAAPQIDGPPGEVTRERLLRSIQELILDSAQISVTYTQREQP